MSKQPEALELSESLAREWQNEALNYDTALAAAAELRRLHSLNAELVDALESVAAEARHPDYDWPLWLSHQVSEVLVKAKEAQQ